MHTFKNFKNFADVEIDLSHPMTLLIGRNGSGKSNVIEGVELLSELMRGRQIHEISDLGRGSVFELRGGLQGCFKQGKEEFEIGFKDKIHYQGQEQELDFLIKFAEKLTSPRIQMTRTSHLAEKDILEYLPKQNEPTDNKNNDVFVLLRIIARLDLLSFDNKIEKQVNTADLLRMAIAASRTNQSQSPLQEISEDQALIDQYIETYAFDIYPRVMRDYAPVGQQTLTKNGFNISSILYFLKQNNADILKKILGQISQLPEEDFTDFAFITSSDDNDVLFALTSTNGERISAKLLSDGTLRALAILTALETVPEGSRIIIEEIDNGVHASRVNILTDAIWEASTRRNLKTLITTHNPATLDNLTEEQLAGVVICHYDKTSQSAKLTPFFQLPRVYELMDRGHLGSLVVRNLIEKYLDPKFEEEQEKIMDEWLESFA